MSLKTTLWLLVVAGALYLMLRFADSTRDVVAEPPRQEMLVESLPGGKAVRVDLSLRTFEDLTMERRGQEWWITNPIEDRVDRQVLDRLTEVLKGNPRLELDTQPSREILERVGLEPPATRVTVYGSEGDPVRIRVGDPDPTGAYCYIMYEGDDVLYRTGANLRNAIDRGMQEWRDRRFLIGDSTMLRRVEIHRPNHEAIVLVRPGTDWMMESPVPFKADSSVVGPIVNGLFLLKVDRFVRANPGKQDFAAVGLTDDVATRVVLDWDLFQVEARFAPEDPRDPEGGRYGVDSERGHIFRVAGRALSLLEVEETDIRDPSLVRATSTSTHRIRLSRPGVPGFEIEFDRNARAFHMTEPFARVVDGDRSGELHSWLLAVSSLRATDFLDRSDLSSPGEDVDPFDVMGFDRPDAVLELDLIGRTGSPSTFRGLFVDDGDHYLVLLPDRMPDTVYVVPSPEVEAVLSQDPRVFLQKEILPEDLLEFREVTVSRNGMSRSLKRDDVEGAAFWKDPDHPNSDTADFQQFITGLQALKVLHFLPRDAIADDGLDTADTATVDVVLRRPSGKSEVVTLTLGAMDSTGQTVVACSTNLPPRTVFRVESRLIKDLTSLLSE